MLSSALLLPLDEPPGLELSPLFGFLAGFSGALGFFLFALKQKRRQIEKNSVTQLV